LNGAHNIQSGYGRNSRSTLSDNEGRNAAAARDRTRADVAAGCARPRPGTRARVRARALRALGGRGAGGGDDGAGGDDAGAASGRAKRDRAASRAACGGRREPLPGNGPEALSAPSVDWQRARRRRPPVSPTAASTAALQLLQCKRSGGP